MTENQEPAWRVVYESTTRFYAVSNGKTTFAVHGERAADRLMDYLNALEKRVIALADAGTAHENVLHVDQDEFEALSAKAKLFDKLFYKRPDGWWLAGGVYGESKRINRRISALMDADLAAYDALAGKEEA